MKPKEIPACILVAIAFGAAGIHAFAAGEEGVDRMQAFAPNDWHQLWLNSSNKVWASRSDAELKRMADDGHPAAQFVLSERWKVKRYAEASEMLEAASKAGLAQAIYEKGMLLFTTATNPDATRLEGWKLIQRAAETGYPRAKFSIAEYEAGFMSTSGRLIQPNLERAVQYFRDVAEVGAFRAMRYLALLYSSGIGEPRHASESPQNLLLEAARRGDGEAMLHLSDRFLVGYGVTADVLESARWQYLGAMASPFRSSYTYLLDQNGEPKAQDSIARSELAKVLSLYSRIEKGEHQAAFDLAERYQQAGKPGQAVALFRIATRLGSQSAAERLKIIEPTLTPDQRALAQDQSMFPFAR
jgi:hypothetical protein